MAATNHKDKVLIVEDDAVTAAMIAANLEAASYQPLTVSNGHDALKVFQTEGPRVIISDWVMPRMNGLELCRAVKARGPEHPLYFIMLTVCSGKAESMEAFEAGVDDFVGKPHDPDELLARVRVGLRLTAMHAQLAERTRETLQLNSQLSRLNDKLAEQASRDDLTGLLNRREAMQRLQEHWDIAGRYGYPLACAMIDLDHFKDINDRFGHQAGDQVLREVASILVKSIRNTDLAFRVGGDEFLIIFPLQKVKDAAIGAERIRAAVEGLRLERLGIGARVTTSIGLAQRTQNMAGPDDLLKAADTALYAAKNAGRDRVEPRNP